MITHVMVRTDTPCEACQGCGSTAVILYARVPPVDRICMACKGLGVRDGMLPIATFVEAIVEAVKREGWK